MPFSYAGRSPPDRALAAARRVRAVELLTSGRTYQQVADNSATPAAAPHTSVAKALKEQTAEP